MGTDNSILELGCHEAARALARPLGRAPAQIATEPFYQTAMRDEKIPRKPAPER